MKKKCGAIIFGVILCIQFGWSQVACDIQDYFYQDLDRWETLGLTYNNPNSRPYPLPLVKEILESVIEKGDSVQRAIAQSHYQRFFSRIYTIGGKSEAATDLNKGTKQAGVALAFDLNYEISKMLTTSFSIDAWAINKLPTQEIVPLFEQSQKDVVGDNARVGPLWVLPSINSSLSYGDSNIYLTVGLMRSSFGPNGTTEIIANPQALHSSQAHFVYNKDLYAFNMSLYDLSATNVIDSEKLYPEKFLVVHTLEARPLDWLSFGVIESIVYGNRFDPGYLFPLTPFFINQSMYGFDDNSWLGLTFTVRPVKGLKLDSVFYADDLSFNDLVKFKFDTKLRFANQTRLAWAPLKSGPLTHISFDYTAILPFTYSHRVGSDNELLNEVNYQNYTHAGFSFGSFLEPNSDRFKLKVSLNPLEGLTIDLLGSYARHGNVNEGIPDKWVREFIIKDNRYTTDGSIYDNSYTEVGHAFNYSNPFLAQKHLRQIVQTGIQVLCKLPVLKTGGYMAFKFGYRFELDINPGVSKSIYTYGGKDYDVKDATKLTEGDAQEVDERAKAQYEAWINNLGGKQIHNYLSLGFEYFF